MRLRRRWQPTNVTEMIELREIISSPTPPPHPPPLLLTPLSSSTPLPRLLPPLPPLNLSLDSTTSPKRLLRRSERLRLKRLSTSQS